jgi:hypothetical protein
VAHGAAAHRERRRRLRRPEEEEGGRRVGHGPEWPGGPNASWAGVERKKNEESGLGRKDDWAEMENRLRI